MQAAAAFSLVKGGAAVANGISGMQAARGEKIRSDTNAHIARTRGKQVNAHALAGMESEVGTLRNNLSANGQVPNSATYSILDELRDVRDRERRQNVGNENRKAMDFDMQGKNASARGAGAMIGGIGRAAPSLYDFANLI